MADEEGGGQVISLAAHRPDVFWHVTMRQGFDGELGVNVHDLQDDPRSRAAAADALRRAARLLLFEVDPYTAPQRDRYEGLIDTICQAIDTFREKNCPDVTVGEITAALMFNEDALLAAYSRSLDEVEPEPETSSSAPTLSLLLGRSSQPIPGAMGAIMEFTSTELSWLSATQLSEISSTQINGLTSTQMVAITPAAIVGISPTAIGGLYGTQIAGLTNDQIAALTTTQISSVSEGAIASITETQAPWLTVTQIQILSPAQCTALSEAAVDALNQAQVAAFSPEQIAAMN